MVETSIVVAGLLKKNDNLSISVYNCRFIKPLDVDMLNLISDKYKNIYVIEEGSILGGFGSSVLEYYNKNIKNSKNSIILLGIDDNFVTHGSRKQLLDVVGLSDTKIYNKIKDTYEK
jgi:1-deoxy-D-xylulose-5-phosphate synthase